jgi:hypothetical protein
VDFERLGEGALGVIERVLLDLEPQCAGVELRGLERLLEDEAEVRVGELAV